LLEALTAAEASGDATAVLGAVYELGLLYRYVGRFDDALAHYEHALDLIVTLGGPEHIAVASMCHNLAGLAHARGASADAVPWAREAVARRARSLGDDHPETAADLAVLGAALEATGAIREAEVVLTRALTIFESNTGSADHDIAVCCHGLAAVALRQRRLADADGLGRRALALKERGLGAEHPELGVTLNNLGLTCALLGRTEEADHLFERAALVTARLEPDHPVRQAIASNQAVLRERPPPTSG
jgi:tetratricopeptide (TPR) repeat protein